MLLSEQAGSRLPREDRLSLDGFDKLTASMLGTLTRSTLLRVILSDSTELVEVLAKDEPVERASRLLHRSLNEGDHGSFTCWLRLHDDRQSHPGQTQECPRVPVGEPEAAVGFGAAHEFRGRGAMDTVAGAVEPDPRHADRVVGTRRKDQFAPQFPGLSLIHISEPTRRTPTSYA